MAKVDGAVGVGRAVVEDVGGPAGAGLPQLVIEAQRGPASQPKRLILRQIRLHREGGLRQRQGRLQLRRWGHLCSLGLDQILFKSDENCSSLVYLAQPWFSFGAEGKGFAGNGICAKTIRLRFLRAEADPSGRVRRPILKRPFRVFTGRMMTPAGRISHFFDIDLTTNGKGRLSYMGVRSSAEYEFWKRGDEQSAGQNPESGVMDAATNPEALTHNGRISLVSGRPLSPDQRVNPGQRGTPQQGAIPERRGTTRDPKEGATEPAANMANDVLTTPESHSATSAMEIHGLDAFLGKAFEEKSVWANLWESIQDVFFPKKLPPLELTSTPIPVPDRLAVKYNPWAVGTATFVNGAILLLVLFLGARAVVKVITKPRQVTNIDVGDINLSRAQVRPDCRWRWRRRVSRHRRPHQGQAAQARQGARNSAHGADPRKAQARSSVRQSWFSRTSSCLITPRCRISASPTRPT